MTIFMGLPNNDIPTSDILMKRWFRHCGGYLWIRLGTATKGNLELMSNVETFSRHVVRQMSQNFTLITTDGDTSVPSGMEDVSNLLQSPLLQYWYTQNYDGTLDDDPRIRPIPIGFDLHTDWPGLWAKPQQYQINVEHMIELRQKGTCRSKDCT